MTWNCVSDARPCEICGKPDWCRYKDDVVHCCRKTEPPPGWRLIKLAKVHGAIFARPGAALKSTPRRKEKSTPTKDWASLQIKLVFDLQHERRDELAAQLGVSAQSLEAIGCGWLASNQSWTFPERNARGEIVGIIKRDRKKIALRGSTRGLTIPDTLPSEGGLVLSPEGASDTAALLTMGLAAVGRFSARGGAESLAALCESYDLLVLGEHDEKGDGSCPGREGALAVAQELANAWGKPVRIAMPPGGAKDARTWSNLRDVDFSKPEACADAGREFLDQVLESAETIVPNGSRLEYEVEYPVNRDRSRITVSLGATVVALETLNLGSSRSRKHLAELVASNVPEIDAATVEADLLTLAAGQRRPRSGTAEDEQSTAEELIAQRDAQADAELADMPAKSVSEAEAMLRSFRLIEVIAADIELAGVVGERDLALTVYLLGTSRLSETPLGCIVQGTSSSGKSYLIERVAQLFPDETLLKITELTPKAMYYMPRGSLMHRWVVAGERRRGREKDENADTTRALREMLSSGRLTKAATVKNNERHETVFIEQPGPIAYIESTTQIEIFDEDANRCLLLSTDESADQTRRIILAEAAVRAGVSSACREEVTLRHHALQRLLRRVRVMIPFAKALAVRIPPTRPEARRAIGHILNLIDAIALLHQRQRAQGTIDHGRVIHATLKDYELARRLLIEPLGRALGEDLPGAASRFGARLIDIFGTDSFTALDASRRDSIVKSKSKAIEYLRALANASMAELVESGRGSSPHIWRMLGKPAERGAQWLPTVDELNLDKGWQSGGDHAKA